MNTWKPITAPGQRRWIKDRLENPTYRVEVRNEWSKKAGPILIALYQKDTLAATFFGHKQEDVVQEADEWLKRPIEAHSCG